MTLSDWRKAREIALWNPGYAIAGWDGGARAYSEEADARIYDCAMRLQERWRKRLWT